MGYKGSKRNNATQSYGRSVNYNASSPHIPRLPNPYAIKPATLPKPKKDPEVEAGENLFEKLKKQGTLRQEGN